MKKLFFTLLAIMALSLNANAAGMCVITGNVEPTVSATSNNFGVNITFTNKNNYMVNVNARITVVSTNGTEQTYTRTYVIAANSATSESFNTGDNTEVKASLTVVSMDVQRCD